MTRNEVLVRLAQTITDADRARGCDGSSELLDTLDRQIVELRRALARLDYPPEPEAARTPANGWRGRPPDGRPLRSRPRS